MNEKVSSLMEQRAREWQPKPLPKDDADLDTMTVEDLNHEKAYLRLHVKNLSEKLATKRVEVRELERDFDRFYKRKETLERKLVGVRRVSGRTRKATRESAGEYQARLKSMTPEELEKEIQRLNALKEVSK